MRYQTIDVFGVFRGPAFLGQATAAPTGVPTGAIAEKLRPRPQKQPDMNIRCTRAPYRWHHSLPPGLRPVRLENGKLTCFQVLRCHQGPNQWDYIYEAACNPAVEKLMGPAPTVPPTSCTPGDASAIVRSADGKWRCYRQFICTAGSQKWEIMREIPCPNTPQSVTAVMVPVIVSREIILVPVQAAAMPAPAEAPLPTEPPKATPAETAAGAAPAKPGGGVSPLAVAGGVGAAGIAALFATGVIKL